MKSTRFFVRHGRRLTLILLALVPFICAAQPADQQNLVYVGTYTEHGSKGIYAYRFDSVTGKLSPLGLAAESVQPSFLVVDPGGRFLYAVNEVDKYNGHPTGAVSAFAIHSDTGKLSLLNQVSSHDPGPAHIVLDRTGKYALVSNYNLGSVAVFPIMPDGKLGDATSFVQHKGSSVDPERQTGPHAHSAAFSPDDHFAVVADLGLDQLLVYRFDSEKGILGAHPQIIKANPGAGPRHLVFSSNGQFLYVINEMQSSVVAYSYDTANGALHQIQSISALPKDFHGENTAAEIAIDPSGGFLFASNRGDDSLAVFAIDSGSGKLTYVETDSTGGKAPRHFAIDPSSSWLLAADQDSDKIVVFRLDRKTGHLTPTKESVPISSPVCVTFLSSR